MGACWNICVKIILWIIVAFVKQTYKFSVNDGPKVSEDVDVSVKGNFVQYHLYDNDTEVWVINDFNTVSTEYIYATKYTVSQKRSNL